MRMVFAVGLILSMPSILIAQEWCEELRADLVVLRDGKMVIEEYSIERINLPGYAPAEYQVKFYMEAPQDGTISRDFFVGFSTYHGITILQTMLAEGYEVSAAAFLAAYESEDLDAPIGTPDLEVSIFMTGEEFQMEIRNPTTNETIRLLSGEAGG